MCLVFTWTVLYRFFMNYTGRWICTEVLGCALCLPGSLNPLCEGCRATTVRPVCCLQLEQLPPFFLYPFSGKGKRGDVCVCFRWGECSPDRLFSGLKWMGERSSMGREVEAASAPLFVSTASVSNMEFVEWEASRSWEMQFKRSYVSA